MSLIFMVNVGKYSIHVAFSLIFCLDMQNPSNMFVSGRWSAVFADVKSQGTQRKHNKIVRILDVFGDKELRGQPLLVSQVCL